MIEAGYAIVMGVLGALVRIIGQRYRGKGYPRTWDHLGGEIFLGGVAGYLIYLAGFTSVIEIFCAGYIGPDFIEMIVRRYRPERAPRRPGS